MINNDTQKNPVVGAMVGGVGMGLLGFGVHNALDTAKIAAFRLDMVNLNHFSRVSGAVTAYFFPISTVVNIAAPIIVSAVALSAAKACFKVAEKHL